MAWLIAVCSIFISFLSETIPAYWEKQCQLSYYQGEIYTQGQQLETALNTYQTALEIAKHSKYQRGIAYVRSRISVILIYGTVTCLIPASAALSMAIAVFTDRWFSAVVLGGSLLVYFTLLLVLIDQWQQAVQKKLMLRGESLPTGSITTFLKLIVALPLTQLVCAIALWQAMLTQQVEWRGITYRVKGPWEIELLEYFPYQYLNRTNPKTSL